MTRRYRVLLPLLVHTEDGAYAQGEEFDKEFTVEDERTNVDSGLLEVVPAIYKVVGPHEVFGTAPGDTFEAAFLMDVEANLIGGGHIERVEKSPTPKPRKTAAKSKE